jgi:REP element-mobilizing transposase RayT
MARLPRIEFPGATYHVTSRGDRREPIYRDDTDRRRQLAVFSEAAGRHAVRALAWCQMGNHCHWVIHTPEGNLSHFMRQLNGVYTQAFNRRHGLVGHVFQGRYHAILVDREAYLVTVCRYVERNPVAAGLVERARDWRWSSCRAHLGLAPAPDWLDLGTLRGLLLGHPPSGPDDVARAIRIYEEGLDDASTASSAGPSAGVVPPRRSAAADVRIRRDLAILDQARAGRSSAEIAGRLGISTRQVIRVVRGGSGPGSIGAVRGDMPGPDPNVQR